MGKRKNKLTLVTKQVIKFKSVKIVTGLVFIFGVAFFIYSNLGTPKNSKGNTKEINSENSLDGTTKLRSFSIRPLEEKACLQWETSSEKNNDYFLIERSWDGLEYEFLGRVKGYGTSMVVHRYKFIDDIPHLGISHYRLSQYNFDGEVQIFEPTEFTYKLSNTEMKLLQFGPNPFIDEISLLMQFPNTTQLRAELFTVDGKKIWETLHGVSAGRESFSLRPEVSSSGVYHLRMSNSEGKAVMTKLVKR